MNPLKYMNSTLNGGVKKRGLTWTPNNSFQVMAWRKDEP